MDTSEKDTDEGTEQDWLPEESKRIVRARPAYQERSGAPANECEACQ